MSEISNGPVASRRWSWLHVLLIVSLGLNLLVAAAAATRFVYHPHPGRMAGMSYLHLIPRKFLADIDKPRREELLGYVKDHRDRFREGRQKSRAVAETLADALDATPYDEVRVRAVLDEFAGNGVDQIGLGTQAARDFISRLNPDERMKLAQRIRERAKGGKRK
ncbi:MAG: periplasmic heavy metal sensor [Rhizobiales bacterium]|nr:periplasmic heavy metal sensor [Hyphomicrobiales bacterium]